MKVRFHSLKESLPQNIYCILKILRAREEGRKHPLLDFVTDFRILMAVTILDLVCPTLCLGLYPLTSFCKGWIII